MEEVRATTIAAAKLERFGFVSRTPDHVGTHLYVADIGIFRVRVRVPMAEYRVDPVMWIGFTAGGSLVERMSTFKHKGAMDLVDEALALARTFIACAHDVSPTLGYLSSRKIANGGGLRVSLTPARRMG